MNLKLVENNFSLHTADGRSALPSPGDQAALNGELNALFTKAMGLLSTAVNNFKTGSMSLPGSSEDVNMRVEQSGSTYTIILSDASRVPQPISADSIPTLADTAKDIIDAANRRFSGASSGSASQAAAAQAASLSSTMMAPPPLSLSQEQLYQDYIALLKTTLNDTSTRYTALEADHLRLTAELEATRNDLTLANADNQAKQKDIDQLETGIQLLNQQIQDLQDQLAETTGQLAALQTDYNEMFQAHTFVHNQLEQLRAQNESLVDDLRNGQIDLAALQNTHASTQAELAKARTDLQEATEKGQAYQVKTEEEIARLESKLLIAEVEVEHKENVLGKLKNQNKALQAQLVTLTKEKADLATRLQQYEQHHAALTNSLADTKAQLAQANTDRTALSHEMRTQTLELEGVQVRANMLQRELAAKNAALLLSEKDLQTRTAELTQARAALAQAEAENVRLTGVNLVQLRELESQKAEITAQAQELAALRAQLAQTQTAFGTQSAAHRTLLDSNAALTSENGALKATAQALQAQVQELGQKHAALEADLALAQGNLANTAQALTQAQVTSASNENAALTGRVQTLESSNAALTAQVAQQAQDLAAKEAEYRAQLTALDKAYQAATQELVEVSKKKIAVLEAKINYLQSLIPQLSLAIQTKNAAMEQAHAVLEELALQQEHQEARDAEATVHEEILENGEKEFAEMFGDSPFNEEEVTENYAKAQLVREARELREADGELRATIANLETELEDLQNAHGKLQQMQRETLTTIAMDAEAFVSLNADLQRSQATNKAQKKTIKELENANEEFDEQNILLSERLDALKAEIATLNAANRDLNSNLAATTSKLSSVESSLGDKETEIRQLESSISSLKEFRRRSRDLGHQNDHLKNMLAYLKETRVSLARNLGVPVAQNAEEIESTDVSNDLDIQMAQAIDALRRRSHSPNGSASSTPSKSTTPPSTPPRPSSAVAASAATASERPSNDRVQTLLEVDTEDLSDEQLREFEQALSEEGVQ